MKQIALLLLMMLCLIPVHGQERGRACGTDVFNKLLMQKRGYKTLANEHLIKFATENPIIRDTNDHCLEKRIIPVAVHFIGIADLDKHCVLPLVEAQMKSLNDDYQVKNADFFDWLNKDAVHFPDIHPKPTCFDFALANSNHPEGYGLMEGKPAITFNQLDKNYSVDFKYYLNFYVVAIEDGILGYSPLGGIGLGDGVVISQEAFGGRYGKCGGFNTAAPYDLGRTLTHEVGHYLLLDHTFNGSCGIGDEVADTPEVEKANYGCPGEVISCGSRDMTMNFMDYTNDACMYVFSPGQTDRMDQYVYTALTRLTNHSNKVIKVIAITIDTPAVDTIITDTLEEVVVIPIEEITEGWEDTPEEMGGPQRFLSTIEMIIAALAGLLLIGLLIIGFKRQRKVIQATRKKQQLKWR